MSASLGFEGGANGEIPVSFSCPFPPVARRYLCGHEVPGQ
jgi:hypothetical protein